ncbi:universal stress protein [Hufsiella ginkgonis]|uniref:Universal stress protein n=1 Tax=Hufsiella ginkgonis TaxID=2695274 RepID=A0A7K1Y228_9SPHI|nr:universal stress protein [Hufsiella ginkgonis]MXV16736.1 universal stress protein [Hufsiella ginkgonis]
MKTILVLTDFSERAEHAAAYAWQLAARAGAKLVFYHSFYVPHTLSADSGLYPVYYDEITQFKNESLDKLNALAANLAWQYHPVADNSRPEYECRNGMGSLDTVLPGLLQSYRPWLIVMGNKRADDHLTHLVMGSDSNEVIGNADCPVMLVPECADFHELKRIEFALAAFCPQEIKGLAFTAGIAKLFDAGIVITHVSPEANEGEDVHDFVEEMASLVRDISYENVSFNDIREDNIPRALAGHAQVAQLEMIAVVHKRYPFLRKIFHKSVTKELMKHHTVPLLVFPAKFVEEEWVYAPVF